jgi:hypothetical protein
MVGHETVNNEPLYRLDPTNKKRTHGSTSHLPASPLPGPQTLPHSSFLLPQRCHRLLHRVHTLRSWVDIRDAKPYAPLPSSMPFPERFLYIWIHVLLTAFSMEFVNALYGVVSVTAGLANPRDCPPMFGSLGDLYSVRSAWSRAWHQQCRRICSAPGIWLTRDVLFLRKGSFASKYVQLFTGFSISGFIHGAASMLVSRSFIDDGTLKCFLGQAALIVLEDHVIDLEKSLGLKDSRIWRGVCFLWNVLAIGWSVEPWVKLCIGNGVWVHDGE